MTTKTSLIQTKLAQNIQTLVGEIGERYVLFHLAILCHKTPPWSVFHNLGEAGFDILLLNMHTNARIKIEVKTRQKMYTTGKYKHRIHFALTHGEYQACDFLIAFFLDQNIFFIVPKTELKAVSEGRLWRFVVTTSKTGQPHPRFNKFINAWSSLHEDFAAPSSLSMRDDGDNSLDEEEREDFMTA